MRKQRKRGQRRLAERWELRTSLDKEEVEKEEGEGKEKEEMEEVGKKGVVEKVVLAFLSPFFRTCCIDFISNVKLVNITIYV